MQDFPIWDCCAERRFARSGTPGKRCGGSRENQRGAGSAGLMKQSVGTSHGTFGVRTMRSGDVQQYRRHRFIAKGYVISIVRSALEKTGVIYPSIREVMRSIQSRAKTNPYSSAAPSLKKSPFSGYRSLVPKWSSISIDFMTITDRKRSLSTSNSALALM